MVLILFASAATIYAMAAGLYMSYLARGGDRFATWTNRVLGLGAALHVAYLVADYLIAARAPTATIESAMALLSLGIVVAFLLVSRFKERITAIGAFVTPVTLLLLLGSGLGHSVSHVPAGVRDALLPVHVGVTVIGIIAFALAFAAALAYIVQERALRKKQLTGAFQRLPALDVLETFGFRAVIAGFPLFSLGIVTGAFFIVRSEDYVPFSFSRGFAVVAWILFASVLLLRAVAGWRGRRAAIGTIMGFLCAMAVLVGYMVRGGAT